MEVVLMAEQVLQDGGPRFLQEFEVYDSEREQAFCSHTNSEVMMHDSGDRFARVHVYEVFVCYDCGLEVQV